MITTVGGLGTPQYVDVAAGPETGERTGIGSTAANATATAATARKDVLSAAAAEALRAPAAPNDPYVTAPVSSGPRLTVAAISTPARGYAASPSSKSTSTAAAAKSTTSKSTSTSKGKTTTTKKSTTSKSSTTTKTSATPTASELAFLDDKKLSVEEKLYRFMALMTKKADQELVDAMKAFGGKKTASTASTATPSTPASTAPAATIKPAPARPPSPPAQAGTGAVGTKGPPPGVDPDSALGRLDWNVPLKEMPPPQLQALGYDVAQIHAIYGGRDPNSMDFTSALGRAGDAVVDTAKAVAPVVLGAAKDLGAPIAAAAVTALGAPELAPIAMKIGSAIGGMISDAVSSGASTGGQGAGGAKSSGTSSGSSSGTSSGTSSASTAGIETTDEKLEMLNLQRLVEKQSAMFAALSNVMKSIHDAQMTAVQNIR